MKKENLNKKIITGLIFFWLSASFTGCAFTNTVPFMRDLAEKRNIYIGAAVTPDELEEAEYALTVAREFNMVVPENHLKWAYVHPGKDVYDFSGADKIVRFALKHDMKIRGHTLVWHKSVPEWMASDCDGGGDYKISFCKEELEKILEEHIKTVVTRYRGKIEYWDVVNEVFAASSQNAELRKSFWLGVLGKEYIEKAFTWARKADEKARLFINDYNIERKSPKSDALYEMIKDLKKKGIPIDGVGFQFHLNVDDKPDFQSMETNIQRFIDIGLEVQFTEIDVGIWGEVTQEKLERQAEIYQGLIEIAIKYPKVTAFVTWGVTDKYSWLPGFGIEVSGSKITYGSGLLFDENYRQKPAYYATINKLK
jgi:endo-1,4-beta-xylanase